MYTFEDRGGRSLTLRPEATAPIARAYLEHGLHREPQPVKLYTIGPMYRYATPQRGRYREHWQLSVEAIGSTDPAIDAELIQLYDELLAPPRRDATTSCSSTRSATRTAGPAYLERLTAWLDEHEDVLDDDARQKRATTPLRVFDVEEPEASRRRSRTRRRSATSLCDDCRAHFEEVTALPRRTTGSSTRSCPTLVRGLDYYTRTAFEFVDEAIGAQSSICGGGRYDGLIEQLGGQPTPGIGFGAGIERLLLSLEEAGLETRARRDRRLLRARWKPTRSRASCRSCRSSVAAGLRDRGRLRGPLAQGAAHAGPAAGREGDRRVGPGALDVRRQGRQDERFRRPSSRRR